jgi:hypothetical protein
MQSKVSYIRQTILKVTRDHCVHSSLRLDGPRFFCLPSHHCPQEVVCCEANKSVVDTTSPPRIYTVPQRDSSERVVGFHTRVYRGLRRTTFCCWTLLGLHSRTKSHNCHAAVALLSRCRLAAVSLPSRCRPVQILGGLVVSTPLVLKDLPV